MYNYHDVFFYYAFGTLNGGGGSIQVIGITEGTTSVTFESNGKPLITYRIYGSSSGVGDLNAETGKYDITVTCNEDTYTISLNAPLMEGEYIDYKTQRLYPSGLDVSMPEISTVSGTNTLTVITTNPSSKVYVECYRAKDIPLPVASTIIGSVPFEFQCYEAGNLMDYSISGNAVQESTPSADAPVEVQGCGVRTGNLWDVNELHESYNFIAIEDATVFIPNVPSISQLYFTGVNVSIPAPFTISFSGVQIDNSATNVRVRLVFDDDTVAEISVTDSSGAAIEFNSGTFTKNLKSIRLNWSSLNGGISFKNFMINSGSTPLPYEPYGYKLPLTVNGTEYPIYLGQVETTRRVKKLVLTGEGNFGKNYTDPNNTLYYLNFTNYHVPFAGSSVVLCTHLAFSETLPSTAAGIRVSNSGATLYINFGADVMSAQPSGNIVAGLKEYLAAQYATGTPVTVWYVLAEPETAVVNEPLMKIGNYADTITFDQAGVNIPVIKGNNVLTINTDVPPSETYIKYNGKEKEYGYYITSDGYIYTTSDGYKYGIRS